MNKPNQEETGFIGTFIEHKFFTFFCLLLIVVITFLFNHIMYAYDQEIKQQEYLNGCMGDYSLQIKLLDVETGNRNIKFTYEWDGEDNSKIFLIGSKYRPFSFTRGNVKYDTSSDFHYFESIPLNKGDTITLNHFIYNFEEFNNYDGEEILLFQKADDKNCVITKQVGVYFTDKEYTNEEDYPIIGYGDCFLSYNNVCLIERRIEELKR